MGNAEVFATVKKNVEPAVQQESRRGSSSATLPRNASQVRKTPEELINLIALQPERYSVDERNGKTWVNIYALSAPIGAISNDASGTVFQKSPDGEMPVLEQMKDKVREDASRMVPGSTQVVGFYGVTPEQSASMIKALENGGATNIEYDGKTHLSFFVKAENYEQACNGAYDAKANGPNPTQGMTDILGSEIVCALRVGDLYRAENGETVKEIEDLVLAGKIQLKSIPNGGDATKWSAGEYQKMKSEWFVGEASSANSDFVIIQKQIGDEKQVYVIPKGYLDLTNNSDVGMDGLSFNDMKNERAPVNSPQVVAQTNILEALKPCFGNVTHVLINESSDIDPELKNLLERMKQNVTPLSDYNPPVNGYYAILAKEEGPLPSNWCISVPFENSSIVMPGETKSGTTKTKYKLKLKIEKTWSSTSYNVPRGGGTCLDPGYLASMPGGIIPGVELKVWRDPRRVPKFFDYSLENGKMKIELPEISSSAYLPSYVPWEHSMFLERMGNRVENEIKNRYDKIKRTENVEEMAGQNLKNAENRLYRMIAEFNVYQKPENRGKTVKERQTLVENELSSIRTKGPDEIGGIVNGIRSGGSRLKSEAVRVVKSYENFQASLEKYNKAAANAQAAKEALNKDMQISIALPGIKPECMQNVWISGLKLPENPEGTVRYNAEIIYGGELGSLKVNKGEKQTTYEINASNKPEITITKKNGGNYEVAFDPENFKNENGSVVIQIGRHEFCQAMEIFESKQEMEKIKREFGERKIPATTQDLEAIASLQAGQTLKLVIGRKEYIAEANPETASVKIFENPSLEKRGNLAGYYLSPKQGEGEPQILTVGNIGEVDPVNWGKNGFTYGDSVVVPGGPASGYGGQENAAPVIIFYPKEKVTTGEERGELYRGTVSEDGVRNYLTSVGCDPKEIDIAMEHAKNGVGYAVLGSDGNRYMIVKENTGSNAEGYAIYKMAVHMGKPEIRSSP